jgi:hypothetical protein
MERTRKTNGFSNANDDIEARLSNRADIIRECCRELAELEAARKTIGQQIREVKQAKIKGDLGMKISSFNVAYRLYLLEGDDRAEFLDTMSETFSALSGGDQLNFMDVLSGEAAGS